jgi:hypothetical protein
MAQAVRRRNSSGLHCKLHWQCAAVLMTISRAWARMRQNTCTAICLPAADIDFAILSCVSCAYGILHRKDHAADPSAMMQQLPRCRLLETRFAASEVMCMPV